MNEEVFTAADERLFDRLVDGELSDEARRDLLLRLERSGDGWRRRALAFLEAQAWRGEARAMIAEPAAAKVAEAKSRPESMFRQAWNSATIWVPLAAAAGFLIAAAYVQFMPPPAGPNAPVVPVAQQVVPPPAHGSQPPAIVEAPLPRPQGNLRLVVAQGPDGRPRVVEVPIVEAERLNDAFFGALPQSIPPEIVQMLEQHGNQVVRERRLVPVDLQDGRRVVVPMDQVEIRPVNLQSFQ